MKATVIGARLGKKRNTLYVKTKSNNIYRYKYKLASRSEARELGLRISAGDRMIDTQHWVKVRG